MPNSNHLDAQHWIEQPDLDLLRGIVAGNSAALGALYDRYGRLIYSLAYTITGEGSQAEEVTQDVFVQVWQKAATYQAERGKVVTWITSIARHRAIDRLRRLGARPEGHQISFDADDVPDPPSPAHVEGDVQLDLEREALRRAMGELPEEQRKALALAYFKGYTHSEIADLTGEALGTVKTRIRLAMKKLRAALEKEFR